jgi:hypothetical protein
MRAAADRIAEARIDTEIGRRAPSTRANTEATLFLPPPARARARAAWAIVAHHHRHFIVGQIQLGQDAVVEGDAAARHAEGVDGVGAQQVDLPVPFGRIRIPAR